jgi:hypothetical protein
MAVLAVHLLPHLTNLGRVLELQAGQGESRRGRIRALIEDGVTAIAILGDDLPYGLLFFCTPATGTLTSVPIAAASGGAGGDWPWSHRAQWHKVVVVDTWS